MAELKVKDNPCFTLQVDKDELEAIRFALGNLSNNDYWEEFGTNSNIGHKGHGAYKLIDTYLDERDGK